MKAVRFAFEFIAVEWRKFFIRIFLMVISLFLIQFSLLYHKGISFGYESCNTVLAHGVNGTAYISFGADVYGYEGYTFLKEVFQLDEVSAFGSMADYGGLSDGVEELLRIQTEKKGKDEMLIIKSINPTLLPFCKMELKEGKLYEELDNSDKNITYIYLGSAYKDIPVGTQYDRIIDGRFYGVWEVAGIFPEGFRWISDNIFTAGNIATMDYTEDCSYSIFTIEEGIFSGGFILCAADGYSIEEALEALHGVADKYGIEYTYAAFNELFEEGKKSSSILSGIIFKVFLISFFCSIIMIINFQSLSLLESGKEMGIMLSLGFFPVFLEKVYLLKSCIQGLIALFLSVPLSLKFAGMIFSNESTGYILKNIYLKNLIPVSLLIITVVVVVCHIITKIIFMRMNPVRLIRKI